MTLTNLKKNYGKFNLNRQLLGQYVSLKDIFLITFFFKEDFIISKKYVFKHHKGIWVIFHDLSNYQKKVFEKPYTDQEIKKQLADFVKMSLKNNNNKSKNIFLNYSLEMSKIYPIEYNKYIKKVMFLPSLYEIFFNNLDDNIKQK